ncbi:hypothetical protein MKX03_008166 [Papaver bracteatum]|nr:hypothetical protein MKX03_008166 [Papaver bracteatum]
MMNPTTSDDRGAACSKQRKASDDDEDCLLQRDCVITACDVVGREPYPTEPYVVRKWDRAVGVRFKEGVVLAAHRLETFREKSGDFLVFAMTGDPVPAEKARRALVEKTKQLVEEGSPTSAMKNTAKFLPDLYNQTQHKDEIELLAIGMDWDELRGECVPCLSFSTTTVSYNPDAYAAGSGAMTARGALAVLYEKNLSLDQATDLALRAIYYGAFSHTVEGQAVKIVEVCVITAEQVTITRCDVKDLHEKYAPLVKEREDYFLRPIYNVSGFKDED